MVSDMQLHIHPSRMPCFVVDSLLLSTNDVQILKMLLPLQEISAQQERSMSESHWDITVIKYSLANFPVMMQLKYA